MYCWKCGNYAVAEAKFCSKCGAKIANSSSSITHANTDLHGEEKRINNMNNINQNTDGTLVNHKGTQRFSIGSKALIALAVVIVIAIGCFCYIQYNRRPVTSIYELADICNIKFIDEDDNSDNGVLFVSDAIMIWNGEGYDFDRANTQTMKCVINHLGADNSYVRHMKKQISQDNGYFSYDNQFFYVSYHGIDNTEPRQYCLKVSVR